MSDRKTNLPTDSTIVDAINQQTVAQTKHSQLTLWQISVFLYASNKFGEPFQEHQFRSDIFELPKSFEDVKKMVVFKKITADACYGDYPTYNQTITIYDFGDFVIEVNHQDILRHKPPQKMFNGNVVTSEETISKNNHSTRVYKVDNFQLKIFCSNDFKFEDTELYQDLLGCRGVALPESDDHGYVKVITKCNNGYQTIEVPLIATEVDVDLYYDEYISRNFDTLVHNVQHTDKGIFILHGLPGTGKTYLIREIARRLKGDRDFIFLPSSMSDFLGRPDFIQFMIEHRGHVLVIEDAENALTSRASKSGTNPSTSNILQLGDGILSDVCQMPIIATFNCSIKEIDKAILRKGRCLFKHEFKELPKEQIDRICESLGKDHLGTDSTLTNVFNQGDEEFDSDSELEKIGFKRTVNTEPQNKYIERPNV